MPRILILAERSNGKPTVVHQEGVAPAHLDNDHSCAQLIERVGWAVQDAAELEGSRRR
jgi:hypothetical protein